jgi:hypothetical protein
MLQHTNPLYIDIVKRMAADAKEHCPEMTGHTLAKAVDIVLQEAVRPPEENAWFYTVQEAEGVYPIELESTGQLSTCACTDESALCVHRLAVRLYIRCQAELRRMIAEDLQQEQLRDLVSPAPAIPVTETLPEMKSVVLLDVLIDGEMCRFTLRDMDDMALVARIRQLRAHFPRTAAAPVVEAAVHEVSDEPERPLAPALPLEPEALADNWCAYHKATMRQNERGWAHKVAEGIWCPGHWCALHNVRFWENKGRTGLFWSHKLSDGGFCSESQVKRQMEHAS